MTRVPKLAEPISRESTTKRVAGPYETERQARDTPAVRAVYAAAHATTRRGVMTEGSLKLLCDAIAAAGVTLGAYDARIVAWLAESEPQACAAIAGIVTRAAG